MNALFLDYENLAIGARDGLGVSPFEFGPVADALAEDGITVWRDPAALLAYIAFLHGRVLSSVYV